MRKFSCRFTLVVIVFESATIKLKSLRIVKWETSNGSVPGGHFGLYFLQTRRDGRPSGLIIKTNHGIRRPVAG